MIKKSNLSICGATCQALMILATSCGYSTGNGGGASNYKTFVWISFDPAGQVATFSMDATTGALTYVGRISQGVNTQAMAPALDGKFLYVTEYGGGGAGGLSRVFVNSVGSDGSLSLSTSVLAGNAAQGAAVTPDGTRLYVTNRTSGTVSGFSLDTASGTPTKIEDKSTGGTSPQGLAVAPSSSALFVFHNSASAVLPYSIGASGALTVGSAGSTSATWTFGALNHEGTFLYVARPGGGGQILKAAVSGATLSSESTFSETGGPIGIVTHPTLGFIYAALTTTGNIGAYSYNASTGSLTLIGKTTASSCLSPQGHLQIDPSGAFLIIPCYSSSSVQVYGINSSDGSLSSVGSVDTSAIGTPYGIAVARVRQ